MADQDGWPRGLQYRPRRSFHESPEKRLQRAGMASLSDAEVLALVLAGNTMLSEHLLSSFGSLRALKKATVADLMRVPGIGRRKAYAVQSALELGARLLEEPFVLGSQVRSPRDGAQLLKAALAHLDHEEFWVLILNTKNRLIARQCLYRGTVNTTTIRVSEVFREAVRHNAPAILIGHNHPSAETVPSPEDIELTRTLVEASQQLDIALLDHIVVGASGYCSIRELGLVQFRD